MDISGFLAALPTLIVSPTALLKYALKAGNFVLAAKIYSDRFGDPIGTPGVLYAIGKYDEAFAILKNNMTNKAVLWLFSANAGEFPRIATVVSFNNDLTLDIFTAIEQSMKPFSTDAFVNALFVTFVALGLPTDSALFTFVEDVVLSSASIHFSEIAIRFLLTSIVSDIFALPDRRQSLLLWILHIPDISREFKQSVLPACETGPRDPRRDRHDTGRRSIRVDR
jgi:hypothetical protein